MILIDTSAWIEYLRATGSPTALSVKSLIEGDIAISDPIRMEILAGARDEAHLDKLRRLLARYTHIHAVPADYEQAAVLYRQCRSNGETVRKLVDCLIAAIAIRCDCFVLHNDVDFTALARSTTLNIYE